MVNPGILYGMTSSEDTSSTKDEDRFGCTLQHLQGMAIQRMPEGALLNSSFVFTNEFFTNFT